eukprot:498997-Prymnesium_polylepis.1
MRVLYTVNTQYKRVHTPHSPEQLPRRRRDAIATGWQHALDATSLVGGRADGASAAAAALAAARVLSRGLTP